MLSSLRALYPTSVVLCALIAAGAGEVQGQREATEEKSLGISLRGGILSHGTGREVHCGDARAPTVGAEVRRSGAVTVAASVDVHATWGLTCFDHGRVAEFRGEPVGQWGWTEFLFDPRFGLHVGYPLELGVFGGIRVEPRVGGGLQWTVVEYHPNAGGDSEAWQPWYGLSVAAGPAQSRFGLEVEVGRHRLNQRYCPPGILDCAQGGDVVILEEFDIWRRFVRLGLSMRVW